MGDIQSKNKTILLAGATGDLGYRIAAQLIKRGAQVKALIRKGSTSSQIGLLQAQGATIVEVNYDNSKELVSACKGSSCIVSALSGLRNVIVDLQTNLLKAALEAQVPRFIPSDFSIDYTKLRPGSNRNLDLRREFSHELDRAPIASTSILNGMFTDLLTGQAPVILFGMKRVLYYGNADQELDFTTIDNTAAYTAAAALDNTTPRYLRIAGEVTTVRGLQATASEVAGEKFKLLRPGGLGLLRTITKITKTLSPKKDEVFPAWQGMQYMHDMFTGLPKLKPLDNHRYANIKWESVRDVLLKHRTDN